MAKLQALWERYPDMRLGQLLMAVIEKYKLQFLVAPVGSKECPPDLFDLEDDRLVEMLEWFVGRGDVGSMPSFVEHLLVIPKDPAEAKMAIAAKMFELKLISSGQAAQILGIRRVDFLLSLLRMGTPAIDLTEEDLISDIRNARTELVNGLEADLLRNGEPEPILEDLVARITPENKHDPADTDFGPDIEREVMDFDYEITEEDKLILAFAKRQHVKIVKEDGGWDNSPSHPEPEIYTDKAITKFLLDEKEWELFQKILERAPKPLNKKLEMLLKGHAISGVNINKAVLARAIEVLEARENALKWFNSPIPALGGQVPADLLKTPEGTQLVMDELENLFAKKQNAKGLLELLQNWEPMPISTLAERFANNPNNGTEGFWFVEGVRHTAIVRAASAPEAAEKAIKTEVVYDWELLDAKFIGTEMPDTFRC